jgi:diacylglycerol O-acyltransferase / trehalose O-mycolyltransferase
VRAEAIPIARARVGTTRLIADSTRRFADAAAAAGVPVTYVVRPEGSHTWGLFESEMQESWNTTIGPALGV